MGFPRFITTKCVLYVVIWAWSSACDDFDKIIEEVTNANTTWKAERNFDPDYSCEDIRRLLGYIKTPYKSKRVATYSGVPLPDEFDARKQWSNCPSVHDILDQSYCGSCWAVSIASTFSDRMCIKTGGNFTLPMSAENLMACYRSTWFAHECRGGSIFNAWEYIRDTGIVTGGDYGSKVGCQPYQLQPCDHHYTNPALPPCKSVKVPNDNYGPSCEEKCINPDYKTSYAKDLQKVKEVYTFDGQVESIQEDIMKNGPVVAGFDVYVDFLAYKSGVYHHVSGRLKGRHAVRVIGWGTENGTPYWLVANSWNAGWGDKGLFKIRRGTDECDFENGMVAGKL